MGQKAKNYSTNNKKLFTGHLLKRKTTLLGHRQQGEQREPKPFSLIISDTTGKGKERRRMISFPFVPSNSFPFSGIKNISASQPGSRGRDQKARRRVCASLSIGETN
jgi:hypothetical protein